MKTGLLLLLLLAARAEAQQALDVLFINGRVLDGAGNPWIRQDVGIRGERIAWLGVASRDKPIARDPRNRQRMAVVASGKPAKTTFVRIARYDPGDLLRVHLFTGRTHQIRVHLASIGHPVAGDDTYGGGGGRRLVSLPPKRHFLHAAWLVFTHPVSGAVIDIRSPLPEDLRAALVRISDGTLGPDGIVFVVTHVRPDGRTAYQDKSTARIEGDRLIVTGTSGAPRGGKFQRTLYRDSRGPDPLPVPVLWLPDATGKPVTRSSPAGAS